MNTLGRDLIDRARQANILAVAQHHGAKLKRAGGGEFVGPCLVCGGRDRFSVNTTKQIWNCRRCSKGGDVIQLVEHVTGRTFADVIERLSGETWPRREISERAQRQHEGSNNSAGAGRIWRAGVSIKGTIAAHYLGHVRGIELEQISDVDDVLRFHPACPFGEGTAPCLVALVRGIITDAPKAIMRTALSADGRKVDRRALGPIGGGAIKLWADASVTTGLVVGEGLETTLAAATRIEHRGTRLQPAWALIDAGNLKTFPVLPGIEALTILVDNDASGTGQDAADECTRRWLAAGCDVEQLIPDTIGSDFNDIARSGGGAS